MFDDADLSGVNFSDSKIYKVSFVNANLERSTFSKASEIQQCNFSGANLTKVKDIELANFTECLFDEKTKFPKGFVPSKKGFVKR